jgi:hypothetical protein
MMREKVLAGARELTHREWFPRQEQDKYRKAAIPTPIRRDVKITRISAAMPTFQE